MLLAPTTNPACSTTPLGFSSRGADRADFRPLDVLSHNGEPVRLDHFDTVVKKKKPRAIGLLDRLIFRCGIVRRV